MTNKKTVVITGGTGLLGGTAALRMTEKWNMSLWTRGYMANFPGIPTETVKLTEVPEINKALDISRPDILIHAAGMTSVEDCEKNQYKANISNVLTTKILAQECKKRGIKFVFISTDHIGMDKEMSTEDELTLPKNIYAKTKLEAEFEALRANPEALIIRTNFFTWGNAHRKSFLDFIVDHLRAKQTITLFDDVRFNPLAAEVLFDSINMLIEKKSVGIFSVLADEGLSKYDFGMLVADIFDLDKKFIKKGHLSGHHTLVSRLLNLTSSNAKFKEELKIKNLPTVKEMVVKLKGEENDYKPKLLQYISSVPNKNLINYGKQSIDEKDFEAIITCLDSGWLTQGPKIDEFEKAVATYTGSKYAVAMANWTCGLHMAVLAADVRPGDYVITSPISFVASSNCAIYAGATPYFVDIDPKTLNLDPIKLAEACAKLGKKVKAIIPVHFAGAPCDMEKISAIAKKYGVTVIEDAAHAIGGSYISGEKIGKNRYSQMVGFSFHPVKNLTTGEGGLITTDDEKIYKKLQSLRSHGITRDSSRFMNKDLAFTDGKVNPWYHEMQDLGYNFRITDLQCSLGVSQINKLPDFMCRKIEIAQAYDRAFAELKNVKTVQHELRHLSGNHLYVVQADLKKIGMSRSQVFALFRERDINLHVHYIPIYKQPYYREHFPVDEKDFPHAEAYYESALSLPLFPEMTTQQCDLVIKTVQEIIG